MVAPLKVNFDNRQRMLILFRPMPLDYLICMAMSGNGAKMKRTIITEMHLQMEVRGLQLPVMAIAVEFCAVELGIPIPVTVVRLFAMATFPTVASIAAALESLFLFDDNL